MQFPIRRSWGHGGERAPDVPGPGIRRTRVRRHREIRREVCGGAPGRGVTVSTDPRRFYAITRPVFRLFPRPRIPVTRTRRDYRLALSSPDPLPGFTDIARPHSRRVFVFVRNIRPEILVICLTRSMCVIAPVLCRRNDGLDNVERFMKK